MGRKIPMWQCIIAILAMVVFLFWNVMKDNGLKDWLDNQDVMLALHVSLRTLQTLRSNGTLPYSRIRNKIFYRRRDIEKLLNENYSQKGGRK